MGLNISLALAHVGLGFLKLKKFLNSNSEDYTPIFAILFDLLVLAVFIGQAILLFKQFETRPLLDAKNQFIDYYDILQHYNLSDIFECLAIVILFALLTRFASLFLDLSIQINVLG